MDIIYIHGLRATTHVGIFDWEREIRQTVLLDLELGTDIRAAAASDSIDDTLDYKSLSQRVCDYIEGQRFDLVERMAEEVARLIMDEFSVPWLRLRLNKKGALRQANDVGILIERGQR